MSSSRPSAITAAFKPTKRTHASQQHESESAGFHNPSASSAFSKGFKIPALDGKSRVRSGKAAPAFTAAGSVEMLEPRSTRSRTSSAADTAAVASSSKDSNLITDLHASPKKRSRIDAQPKLLSKGPRGKHAQAQAQARASDPELPPLLPPHLVSAYTTVAHPTLPFSLSTAIAHLRQTDARFDKLFALVPLRPFLELERSEVRELDLFKTLCTSILGQQISFLAARSVLYKFCRLFVLRRCTFKNDAAAGATMARGSAVDRDRAEKLMPEQPDYEAFPREKWPFPTPHEVLEASDDTLRGAGLSGQKVKYIRDVARRFADGRLDARKLIAIEEEEVVKELVQIKGVGLWTAEMLLMFALRRPNVLPVGDLGIQRGMLLFYLASAPKADEDGELMLAGVSVSERKQAPEKVAKRRQGEARCQDTSGVDGDALMGVTPSQAQAVEAEEVVEYATREVGEKHASQMSSASAFDLALPSPATGAADVPLGGARRIQPIPAASGLTPATLRARKDGKKVKGAYLTPEEMRALAQPWEPYRSIASFFMYALIDDAPSK